ncbi:MAG: DUF434 domain-containing protein [Nitrososphaeria archaeon]|nr:DUF434 domain-containing protein [Aigarchaeota archaeon]MCX8187601.1 DUF434 domain-containing protein [Nitrososphaeria archaeon]MDW8021265.1 DUF434 domain-containing protein [Nitrososphaerota archaeon]
MDIRDRLAVLRDAAADLRYLLNRGYNRSSALRLIGDRYQLSKAERSMLFRSVFSDEEAAVISSKMIGPEKLRGEELFVDGFNVLNTVEAILRGEYLVLCDDGVLRDFSEIHSGYKLSELTAQALGHILVFLSNSGTRRVEIIFESQISRSGEVAGLTRRMLEAAGIEGTAKTSKTVDSTLIKSGKMVATSDSVILLRCRLFVDIPQCLNLAKDTQIISLKT